MNKLFSRLVISFTPIIGAGVYADGITTLDQKYVISDYNAKLSVDLREYIGLAPVQPYHLYVDGIAVDLIDSRAKGVLQLECDYVLTLGQDNSIKVTASYSPCTNKEFRAAAPPYQLASAYIQGAVVSFTNTQKGTVGLYQCFNDSLCSARGYGPEQELGDEAWVLISKRYVTPKKSSASQTDDTYSLDYKDYKHAPYFENIENYLPLAATLKAKKDDTGYIEFYVENTLIGIPQRSVSGDDCNYAVTLNVDNSVLVHSRGNGCFRGNARKASEPYKSGAEYERGDVVIEKNNTTRKNYYFQCIEPNLCSKEGYGPTGQEAYLAWSQVFSNRFPPERRVRK